MSRRWTVGGVVVLSYAAAVAAALWPNTWGFVAAALAGYVAEAAALRLAPDLGGLLSRASTGITVRFLIRELALLLLLIRTGHAHDTGFVVLTAGLLCLHGVRGAQAALALRLARRRRLPVVTRRIDLSDLAIPDSPPAVLATRNVRTMLHLDLAAVLIAPFAVAAGVWGLAAGYALGAVAICVTARHASRNGHLDDEDRVFATVNRGLAELRPEVILYFSGSLDSAYQANMWLSTLDGLGRRALIVLRERGMVPLLGRTRTPVLCVPSTLDLARLDLSSARCALYPANVGKNLHMLRMPAVRSAFVGHGDSDKPASFNPYSKVYDEVWVAGPAGRERYLTMRTGVRAEDIVEVGRPQLAPIDTTCLTPDPVFTVLYAPTWEGWSEDLAHSSVPDMGGKIVRSLLAHAPEVRVLYKPHPLTGTRDPRAIEAHEEIVALIERANATREAGDAAAADRLASLSRRLESLGGDTATAGDEAQRSRDAGRLPAPEEWQESEEVWRAAEEEWRQTYWAAAGPWRHQVVTGSRPDLYDCFNRADLLITDISSVVGDFIASGKPFAVTNVNGADPDEFRAEFPTAAAAAFLINPDCGELPEILKEAQTDAPDSLVERRGELKRHLLGPDEPDSVTRFGMAVAALISKSLDHADDDRPAA